MSADDVKYMRILIFETASYSSLLNNQNLKVFTVSLVYEIIWGLGTVHK